MPTIPLHPPPQDSHINSTSINPLPTLLQTPSGLAILELQGSINTPAPEPASTSDSTPVGRLVFPHHPNDSTPPNTDWMKTVHLYVGRHQRLTGEVKQLAKPLAVMRRRQVAAEAEGGKEELEIVELVYYKIVFSSRPEPVGDLAM